MDEHDVNSFLAKFEKAWDKKTGDDLDLANVRIEKRKDHEKKPAIYRFIHNDDVYNRRNHVMLKYKCFTCDRPNMCALNNVMGRINKNYKWCNVCKDFLNSPEEIMRDKIKNDLQEFDFMPEEFKQRYWSRHLTREEFDKFRPFILSIGKGGRIKDSDLSGFEYVECATMNEGRHNFMPYLYNSAHDIIERIGDIRLRCEQCGDEFVSKDFKRHKARSRMLCLACTANLPFCIKDKPFENLEGATVYFKTRYESKFLRFCNKHDMVVENGPETVYPWLHHQLEYRIPYFIRKIGMLVDIKDNHQWRNEEEVNVQKTASRKRVIQDLIDTNTELFKGYVVLYPGNYVKETRKLVVAYHNMTSFKAWARQKKEEKMRIRAANLN